MRTRTLITGAAVLVVGVSSAGKAHAQLNLRGSDTLDLVTTDTIAACTGAAGLITYVGGGSGNDVPCAHLGSSPFRSLALR